MSLTRPSTAVPAILWCTLIAGTLDMSDALIYTYLRGGKPYNVLLFIASGMLGPKAFSGGPEVALLGLAFHFLIIITAATIYYAASREIPFLNRNAVLSGLVYGGIIYLFMNKIVLPLSHTAKPTGPPPMISLVNGVLAVVLFVGLTIALIVRRFSTR